MARSGDTVCLLKTISDNFNKMLTTLGLLSWQVQSDTDEKRKSLLSRDCSKQQQLAALLPNTAHVRLQILSFSALHQGLTYFN